MTTTPGKVGVSKIPAPKAGTTKGRNSSPLSLFGSGKTGKAATQEALLPGQKTTVTPGDPVSRSMGQYGKDASYLPDDGSTSSIPIRNAGGGIRDRPRSGGLGGQFQRAPEVPF
jgi:hypothetical protein